MTLPKGSVRTSSVKALSSSRAISRCCSSRPGTPGVSINRFNSFSFNVTGLSSFVRLAQTFPERSSGPATLQSRYPAARNAKTETFGRTGFDPVPGDVLLCQRAFGYGAEPMSSQQGTFGRFRFVEAGCGQSQGKVLARVRGGRRPVRYHPHHSEHNGG